MRKKIVTIGGGTGQYILLSGLKHKDVDICAIVSMADDGGTTGTLRDEMGVLPPTDVRKCLIALSWATPKMRKLFGYRFSNKDLEGHTVGNLIISALEKTTGNFADAVREAGKIFNIQGTVLPVTDGDMRLQVYLKNGKILDGERLLDDNKDVWEHGVEQITLASPMRANAEALHAIEEADTVIIGPGDLYGSIAPNLLVDGIPEALQKTKAKIIYVSNLTNKRGQTEGFSANEYVKRINNYIGSESVDILLCNSEEPEDKLRERYEEKEGKGMFVMCLDCDECDYKIVRKDLLNHEMPKMQEGDTLAHTRSFIRHDSHKLADAIMSLI